jgi:hypothetical protein
MKALVVLGSVCLALGAIGGLLWRVKSVEARPCETPPPLPPRTYTYKDVIYSLN